MALSFNNLGITGSAAGDAQGEAIISGLTANVGEAIVVVAAVDNSGPNGTSPLISGPQAAEDNSGNFYTKIAETVRTPSNAISDGSVIAFYYAVIDKPIDAGFLTIYASSAISAKAYVAWRIVPDPGEGVQLVLAGTGVAASGTSFTLTTDSITTGNTVIAGIAVENRSVPTADSDTTNGAWSAQISAIGDSGTAATSIVAASQYKTVTATGIQVYNPSSGGGSRDASLNYIVLKTVPLVFGKWAQNGISM